MLAQKPAHWLGLWKGTWINAEGGPGSYRPQNVSHDNIREINAMTHIMNELIDEACGRVLAASTQRGWDDDTDVFFTTDHGELQGDYGLDLQGPVPHRFADAPADGVAAGAVGRRSSAAVVAEPVGQLDLAPTFCEIAGVPAPEWMQGEPLPTAPGSGRERVLCEWDTQFPGYGMHLRSIYRDGWLCTAYEPSTVGEPNGLEKWFAETGMFGGGIGPISPVAYDGSEGELYEVERGSAPVREPLGRPRVQSRARRPRRRHVRRAPQGTQHPRSRAPRLATQRTCVVVASTLPR